MISSFGRLIGLTPSALRFYGDCGVLQPASVDPTTGYRLYRVQQERRAVLLRDLREIGLPLSAVRVVLDAPAQGAPARCGTMCSRWRPSWCLPGEPPPPSWRS
jgi:DNA-binding transcriptional MerR regulator